MPHSDYPGLVGITYWIDTFFVPQLETLRVVVADRILPLFEKIDEEAEAVANETFKQLGSSVAGDDDPASLAETARDAGIAHYAALFDARQGLLNLFAVAVRHQFEQQCHTLVRRELRRFGSPEGSARQEEFLQLMQRDGIDPTSSAQWLRIEELRLAANVAKHAEGRSAEELESLRPDLFVDPRFRNAPIRVPRGLRRTYQPLSGKDLHLGPADLEIYFDAVTSFWRDLAEKVRWRFP